LNIENFFKTSVGIDLNFIFTRKKNPARSGGEFDHAAIKNNFYLAKNNSPPVLLKPTRADTPNNFFFSCGLIHVIRCVLMFLCFG